MEHAAKTMHTGKSLTLNVLEKWQKMKSVIQLVMEKDK